MAFWSFVATTPHGEVSEKGPSAVGDESAVGVDDAWTVGPLGRTAVPQLPQNRSSGRTAPPQHEHVEVVVGVIVLVRQSAARAWFVARPHSRLL